MVKDDLVKKIVDYNNHNIFTYEKLNSKKNPELITIAKELDIKNIKKLHTRYKSDKDNCNLAKNILKELY